MSKNLADWVSYLEPLDPKTMDRGLARVADMKQRLNLSPDFPVIVVGGTNGKGSVCAMLESIFYAAGYSVGCYTSPHLLRYNERVRISKQTVSDEMLCASFERIEQAEKPGAQLWRLGHEFGFKLHQGQWDYRSNSGTRNALPHPALR